MARDLYHHNVREALLKEGWNITDDPLRVPIDGGSYMEIDLAAEILFGAEKGDEKIAVEVKSFLGKSFSSLFQRLGGMIRCSRLRESRLDVYLISCIE